MKRIVFFKAGLAAFLLIFLACSPDNGISSNLIEQSTRNTLDDQAIEKYLTEHYFSGTSGRVLQCENLDCATQGETALADLNPQTDTDGFVYVFNPNVTVMGNMPTSTTDEIELQYISYTFVSSDVNGTGDYGTVSESFSTINGSGIPEIDPEFWKVTLSDSQIDSGFVESEFEMEGVQDALQMFSATNRSSSPLNPPVQFQGIILVPSRLAFGRSINRVGFGTDFSFILNFELISVNP